MAPTDYTNIANRITALDDAISKLSQERDELKSRLLADLEPGSRTQAGDYTISVSRPTRRLNTRAITAQYPVHLHPALYKAVIDTTLVRENIASATLEAEGLYTESTPRVTIR